MGWGILCKIYTRTQTYVHPARVHTYDLVFKSLQVTPRLKKGKNYIVDKHFIVLRVVVFLQNDEERLGDWCTNGLDDPLLYDTYIKESYHTRCHYFHICRKRSSTVKRLLNTSEVQRRSV